LVSGLLAFNKKIAVSCKEHNHFPRFKIIGMGEKDCANESQNKLCDATVKLLRLGN